MPSTTFKCAEKQNLAETNDRYALICTDLPEEKHADFYYSNCCQNNDKSWRREDTCKSVASIDYLGNEAEFYEWMSSSMSSSMNSRMSSMESTITISGITKEKWFQCLKKKSSYSKLV